MRRKTLTADRLRYVMDYDPDTGVFIWRGSEGGRFAKKGKIAGANIGNGYLGIGVDGVHYRVSRLAVLWMTGVMPTKQVDHINGIRDDNRWANLRQATRSDNIANSKLRKDNKSGFKGVHWNESARKWRAHIRHKGKGYHLGSFDAPEEAYQAYCRAAREMFGEFARFEKRDALRALGLDVRTV